MAVGNTRRVIAAGAIGNVLEWYDFAVYGYFAAAIGRAFFPQEDKVAQVLAAFGIFAVGFLMRPVGGALIGYIGDRSAGAPRSPSRWRRWRCRPSWSACCPATRRWAWRRRSCSRSCA